MKREQAIISIKSLKPSNRMRFQIQKTELTPKGKHGILCFIIIESHLPRSMDGFAYAFAPTRQSGSATKRRYDPFAGFFQGP